MKTLSATLLTAFSLLVSAASYAQSIAPQPIDPATLRWVGPPGNPLLKGAWVLGAESEAGLYAFRVLLQKGGRIPVHTHPDTRYSTVLSGTLYVGFGNEEDDSGLVAIPEGQIYVAPAGVPHFLHAKDGDVIYQEGGMGPTATVPAGK